MPLHVAAALPQPVRDLIAEGGNTLPGDDALVAGAPGFGRAAPRVNPDWRG